MPKILNSKTFVGLLSIFMALGFLYWINPFDIKGVVESLGIFERFRSLPADAAEIVLSKESYEVGEEIIFGVQNRTDKVIMVDNECPYEPLEIYRWNDSRWEHIKAQAKVECRTGDQEIVIEPHSLVGSTFLPWSKIIFNETGKYRLELKIHGFANVFYKEFEIKQKITMEQEKKTAENTTIIMRTSMGDITLKLFDKDAPKTVANFKKLASQGFYNGTRFHRVIKDFMIQGGDPLSKDAAMKSSWGTGGPGYAFEDEINAHKLARGVLAMANAGPNTNGSQFFIVTAVATPWLDGHHTVFGEVILGMDVVAKIELTPTDKAAGDKPVTDVVVSEVKVQ
jgi:cyclophilin family peptidyl-prolyl cis-trans isomerase